MMADPLEFALLPAGQTVYYEALVKAFQDINTVIRRVDYAVTRDKHPRPWRVVGLRNNAPTVTIEPAIDGVTLVDALTKGFRAISHESDEGLPAEFNETVMSDIKGMSRLFRGPSRLSRVVVRTEGEEIATIDSTVPKRIDSIERSGYLALGSIEGTLDAINIHAKKYFTIWDRVTGVGVRCSIPKGEDWQRRVITLLQRRVLVRGTIRYLKNGRPLSIAEITHVIERQSDPTLPTATFGSIPDLTGGLDSVEYLQKIRG